MEQEINPFIGFGQLTFGSHRAAIRTLLDSAFTTFTRPGSNPIDAYDTLGLHLHYDDKDELEFIETFAPSDPRFRGITLLGDLETVLQQMAEMGIAARYEDGGYFFDEVGFALYAPVGEIEAVSIYRRGYYGN